MTTARLLARHDARATELEIPFVLESARWGYRTVDSWVADPDTLPVSAARYDPQINDELL